MEGGRQGKQELSAALSSYLEQSCCKTYATKVYALALEDLSLKVCNMPNKSLLGVQEVPQCRAASTG